MRRQEKAISDWTGRKLILDACKVCRIAMVDKGIPYVVPMNFGYTFNEGQLTLYFHSALEGRKIDAMRHTSHVAFEMDIPHGVTGSGDACEYSFAYASLTGEGDVHFIEGRQEKRQAFEHIMRQMTGQTGFTYSDAALDRVGVFYIIATSVSAKGGKMPTAVKDVTVRAMEQKDIQGLNAAFAPQGTHPTKELLQKYLSEQSAGQRDVFVACADGEPVGYVTLLPNAAAGPFKDANIPLISDFNVVEAQRRRGIGNLLMANAEERAFQKCPQVCLGVGMHPGYGSAQRMYMQRGYIPDGSGLWYQDRPLEVGANCINDDDLVLYLIKRK